MMRPDEPPRLRRYQKKHRGGVKDAAELKVVLIFQLDSRSLGLH